MSTPIRCCGDERVLQDCFHCGRPAEIVDYIPPRVLLDQPFPVNSVTVPACHGCNNSASRDQSYLACVIECAVTGEVEPDRVSRPAISKMLTHSPALMAEMAAIRKVTDKETKFYPDIERTHRVIVKLARAHAAYELHEDFDDAPTQVDVFLLSFLSDDQRRRFEGYPEFTELAGWPEVGSRAMQRIADTSTYDLGEGTPRDKEGWVIVQKGRYRYLAADRTVKIVLSEYLGCTIIWD